MLVHRDANHSSMWTKAMDIFATALFIIIFFSVIFGCLFFKPYCFAFSSGSSIDIKLLNMTQNKKKKKNNKNISYFILRLDKIIAKLTGVKSTANNNVINQLFFGPWLG